MARPIRECDGGICVGLPAPTPAWDLALASTRVANIARCYEAPTDPYRELTGAVAFYASRLDRCLLDDEVVRPESGTFYGGWVTSDIAV